MTMRYGNGTTTTTVPANQGTYVGSMYMDATNGQVSCHVSAGQNRKFGLWNTYNRAPITVQALDSTANWTYNTATIRASNNAPSAYAGTTFNLGSGTAANGITTFTGLAEEFTSVAFEQNTESDFASGQQFIGIGFNSTTAFNGIAASANTTGSTPIITLATSNIVAPSLGINVSASLEKGSGVNANIFLGTSSNMILQATWRG